MGLITRRESARRESWLLAVESRHERNKVYIKISVSQLIRTSIALDYNSDTNKALAPFDSEGQAWAGRKHGCEQVWLNMQALKFICDRTVGLFKLALRFPHSVAMALQQRRRQFALNALEAERLDRIRNPSKYLGR